MVRVIACDDGRVEKLGGGRTLVTCISWSREGGVEDLGFLPVHVDGLDASSILSYLVSVLSPGEAVDAILLDSLTIAGFNIVSPDTLYRSRGTPVIIVYSYKPSYSRLSAGLEASQLPLLNVRRRILELVNSAERVDTLRGELYLLPWRISLSKARDIIISCQDRDKRPAPLRMAHYISSALSRIIS